MFDLAKLQSDLKAADLKDAKAIVEFIGSYKPATLTAAQLESAIEAEPGHRKWLEAVIDRKVSKGINAWKGGHLQKEIDDAVAKANPKETGEQKRLRELETREQTRSKNEKRLLQENLALRHAREMNLPEKLVTYLIGDDDDTTLANLKVFKETIDNEVKVRVEAEVKKRFKEQGDEHNASANDNAGINPFKKETRNVTEQSRLYKEDPKKAKALAAAAGIQLNP